MGHRLEAARTRIRHPHGFVDAGLDDRAPLEDHPASASCSSAAAATLAPDTVVHAESEPDVPIVVAQEVEPVGVVELARGRGSPTAPRA